MRPARRASFPTPAGIGSASPAASDEARPTREGPSAKRSSGGRRGDVVDGSRDHGRIAQDAPVAEAARTHELGFGPMPRDDFAGLDRNLAIVLVVDHEQAHAHL